MDDFLKDGITYLVVGATQNKNKYGYRVFAKLLEKGKRVLPINPKYDEIEGVLCYDTIENAKLQMLNAGESIDDLVVVTVVPPKVTEKVVEKAAEVGIKKVWMQPGSESKIAVEKGINLGVETVQACIVVDGFGWSW